MDIIHAARNKAQARKLKDDLLQEQLANAPKVWSALRFKVYETLFQSHGKNGLFVIKRDNDITGECAELRYNGITLGYVFVEYQGITIDNETICKVVFESEFFAVEKVSTAAFDGGDQSSFESALSEFIEALIERISYQV